MIIQFSCKDCTNMIVGVCGASSFYEKFDKVLKRDFNQVTIGNLKDPKALEKLFELVRQIRSHWNKKNDSDFGNFIKQNLCLFENFLNTPEDHYKKLIYTTTNIGGIQNTKVSKFLHILKPDFVPMIDPQQGKLLIEKYNRNSRSDLIKAIRTFHKQYNRNHIKVLKIQDMLLEEHVISLSELRVFELLIWLQAKLNEKKIGKQIFKN